LDVQPGRPTLPADVAENDYLEFLSLGAYGAATATHFNGYGTHDVVPVAS
jgi:ornithine decarboxylase